MTAFSIVRTKSGVIILNLRGKTESAPYEVRLKSGRGESVMTTSPALAEAALFDRSPAGYYLWEVTRKPVSVHLSPAVVDRLAGHMQRSFRSITARGSGLCG